MEYKPGDKLRNPETGDVVVFDGKSWNKTHNFQADMQRGLQAASEGAAIGRQGTNQGLLEAGQGVKQLGLGAAEESLLMPRGTQDRYTQDVGRQRQAFEQSPAGQSRYGQATRFMGATAPFMAVPGGQGTLPARIAKNAVTGAGIGASQFVPEGGSRLSGLLGGAAGGAIGTGVGGAIEHVGGKLANAGSLYGSQRAQNIVEQGERHNVPVYHPDIAENPISPKASVLMEDVPFVGMAGPRIIQNKKAGEAAQRLAGKYSTGADDIGQAYQQSMGRKFDQISSRKAELYNKVSDIAGDDVVPTPTLQRTSREIIDEESKKVPEWQRADFIKEMEKYTVDPKMSFSQLQIERARLGDDISDISRGAAKVSSTELKRAKLKLKSAMSADMRDYAVSGPEALKKAWTDADRFYRKAYVPQRDMKLIKNARETHEPDMIHQQFIKNGHRDRARMFYNALDADGKATVRYGIVQKAYDDAMDVERHIFSPAKFSTSLKKQGAAAGVFFRGADKKELDGFRNLMRAVQRSGQYMENPPTGQRMIAGGVLAGGAAASPSFTGTGLATVAGMRMMFTTAKGRDFLAASSDLSGRPLADTLGRVEKYLSNVSAVEAGTRAGSYQEPSPQPTQQ